MRYSIMARPRAWVVAFAAAGAFLLALAGGASAETYKASTTAQFVEAVSKANANAGANTIVLASGVYTPEATVTFTNTTGLQTVEGPATAPPAKIEGGAVMPAGAELFVIKASVSVTFKKVVESTGGSGGVPAIDDAGTMTIESSTFGGNNGPAVHVETTATATVRNSTLSDGSDFGVIDNGTASFFNATVAFNKNGGIENRGTLNLTNTIVAKNTGSGDCVGEANTSDHSLDSDGKCGVGATGLSNTDPLLGKLVNNGGPTPTRALLLGSKAIDAGNTATCIATVDQRGSKRPDVPATACDMGAYEFQAEPHWYKNNVPVAAGAEGLKALMWGNVTLSAGTEFGSAVCQTLWSGNVYNPEGAGTNVKAGEMKIAAFSAYDCGAAPTCEEAGKDNSKVFVEPENLGVVVKGGTAERLQWEGKLSGTAPIVNIGTPEATQIKLHVVCPKTTSLEYNKTWAGELKTAGFEGGSAVGSSPAKLEFSAAGLTKGTDPEGKVTAKLKMMGYEGQEFFTSKNP